MTDAELLSLLRLQRLPHIGDISAKKLLQKFGSAEALFKTKKADLMKINGVGSSMLKEFHAPSYIDEAENELKFIKDNEITVTYFKDSAYPELLKQCIDAPILLFQKGNINLKNRPLLSIVGTRKATVHGTYFCEQLIAKLAPLNPVIISGFAYGIDIAAHKSRFEKQLANHWLYGARLEPILSETTRQIPRKCRSQRWFFH